MINSDEDIPDWEYAKRGIIMWLNNDPLKAEQHFKQRLAITKVYSSYALITVMNAVISYEVDKIEAAQEMLREVEQRCTPRSGWIQAIRSRIFGDEISLGLNKDAIEEKIILADMLVCSAILTFLTQDMSGLMKGSWLLRRAWKIYEQLYGQVFRLYMLTRSEIREDLPDQEPVTPTNFNGCVNEGSMHRSQSTVAMKYKHFALDSPQDNLRKINQFYGETRNAALNSSSSINERDSGNSSRRNPSKSQMHLHLPLNPKNGITQQVPLSCPDASLGSFLETSHVDRSGIDWPSVKRLMGAVSFGFGIFQLCVSLLPPTFLRLISFLGFEGNKMKGISCLNFARTTDDMRAPLATLVLLWYYTIGAQLFYTDDKYLTKEIEAARQLLKDSRPQYATSAIFLFFNGRLKRLQCKLDMAVDLYDAAYRMSAQRELKLLCLHEVGWCRLLRLDFGNATLHFHELKVASNFSKSFYSYLTMICQGAFGRFDNLVKLKREIRQLIERNHFKETQIEKFIGRRIDKLPSSHAQSHMFNARYWRLLVYEMLFLWNAMQSCPTEIISGIMSDCLETDDALNEPSLGLTKLILGSCKIQLRQSESAIQEFRECLNTRDNVSDDIYISAYASYELAMALLKHDSKQFKLEAKSLLSNVQRLYKNYDFENRLSARVYAVLKVL